MTWYFNPSGTTVDVYDHTGTLVASGREFSGRWTDEPPQVVYDVMDEEAVSAYENGDTMRMLQCLRHGAFGLVEEGTPPA